MNKIIIKDLYEDSENNNNNYFEYSSKVEYELCRLVFGEENIDNVSEGNSPEWDVRLKNGTTIEVKVQSSKNCFFETEQADAFGDYWKDSGLNKSTADYWLMINPGSSWRKDQWAHFGKLRLFKTVELKETVPVKGEPITYEYTKGISICAKQLNDLWIADLPILRDEHNKVIGYDLSNFKFSRFCKPALNKICS